MGSPQVFQQITEKHALDAAALGITAGTLTHMLPAIAAAFSILWIGLNILNHPIVQKILKRFGGKKDDKNHS